MDPPLQYNAGFPAVLHSGAVPHRQFSPPNLVIQASFPAPFKQTDWSTMLHYRVRDERPVVQQYFPLWVNEQYLGLSVVTAISPYWVVSVSFG